MAYASSSTYMVSHASSMGSFASSMPAIASDSTSASSSYGVLVSSVDMDPSRSSPLSSFDFNRFEALSSKVFGTSEMEALKLRLDRIAGRAPPLSSPLGCSVPVVDMEHCSATGIGVKVGSYPKVSEVQGSECGGSVPVFTTLGDGTGQLIDANAAVKRVVMPTSTAGFVFGASGLLVNANTTTVAAVGVEQQSNEYTPVVQASYPTASPGFLRCGRADGFIDETSLGACKLAATGVFTADIGIAAVAAARVAPELGSSKANNACMAATSEVGNKGKEKVSEFSSGALHKPVVSFGSFSVPLESKISLPLKVSGVNNGGEFGKKRRLCYVKPYVRNGEVIVQPEASIGISGAKRWNCTLVGYFLGRTPFLEQLKKYFLSIWRGLKEVVSTAGGFFFFKFESEQQLVEALEGGPWLFQGQPIFLTRWTFGMSLEKVQPKFVPVWVKLRNIPLEYWTDDGLSVVASAVGEPLYADVFTRNCMRLDYARVCILLDAEVEPIQSFSMVLPSCDGEKATSCRVTVEYEWVPHRCSDCRVFGHRIQVCPCKVRPTVQKRQGKHIEVYVTKGQVQASTVSPSSTNQASQRKNYSSSVGPGIVSSSGNASVEKVHSSLSGIDLLMATSVPVYSVVTRSSPCSSPRQREIGDIALSHNRFAALDGSEDEELVEEELIVDHVLHDDEFSQDLLPKGPKAYAALSLGVP